MSTDGQNAAGTVYATVRDDNGNVVSSTATTTNASGEVVSVVEREFDGDGNVVSATYTDHSVDYDTGEIDTDVTVYESGVMTEEVSTRTSADGAVLEESVTTFDADGDRDVTTVRTYDPGGGPLETRTVYYTDDGERMRTETQLESGRTEVSYDSGTHVRTNRNDDGTVTRESVQVDETGTVRYSTTQVTDSSGEIQTSSETYNDQDGHPENVIEVGYTDGRATSMTTTATDDDGTYVSEKQFDEDGNPTTEVRTSYDTEGNVTDTSTMTPSSETSGTSSGNADADGSAEALDPGSLPAFREAVDLPDLGQPTTPLDASDALAGATGQSSSEVAEGSDGTTWNIDLQNALGAEPQDAGGSGAPADPHAVDVEHQLGPGGWGGGPRWDEGGPNVRLSNTEDLDVAAAIGEDSGDAHLDPVDAGLESEGFLKMAVGPNDSATLEGWPAKWGEVDPELTPSDHQDEASDGREGIPAADEPESLDLDDVGDEGVSLKIGDIAGESQTVGDEGVSLKIGDIAGESQTVGDQSDADGFVRDDTELPDPFAPAPAPVPSGTPHPFTVEKRDEPTTRGDNNDAPLESRTIGETEKNLEPVASVADGSDEPQLADPFTPSSQVSEEIKVTSSLPDDTLADAPVEFDDPLAAPSAPQVALDVDAGSRPVIDEGIEVVAIEEEELMQKEPAARAVESQVDLPAVQMEPVAEVADVSVSDTPTFEEPIDHSVVREGLDLDGADIDLDGPPDADSFDDGFTG